MVAESAPIEDHCGNSFLLRSLREFGADGLRAFRIALAIKRFLLTAGCGERGARRIVDNLCVDVLQAAKYRQPRPRCGPLQLLAKAVMPCNSELTS